MEVINIKGGNKMRHKKRQWFDDDDLLRFKESRRAFSRSRALKVKRELRRLAYF